MEMLFNGGGEIVRLMVDRKKKKLFIASSKTDMELVETDYKQVYDPGMEEVQEEIYGDLCDKCFKKAVVKAFKKIGYVLER